MGDRTISYLPCPQCGKEYELYDAPSSLMYLGTCENCGWTEPKNYYEVNDHTTLLDTKEGLEKHLSENPKDKEWFEKNQKDIEELTNKPKV